VIAIKHNWWKRYRLLKNSQLGLSAIKVANNTQTENDVCSAKLFAEIVCPTSDTR